MESIGALLTKLTFILKIAELILAVTCAVMIGDEALDLGAVQAHIIIGTILAYTIVNLICILSYIMKTILHRIITLIIALGGSGLFIATGVFMMDLDETIFRVPGILAFVNGGLYFLDGVLSYREGKVPEQSALKAGLGVLGDFVRSM